MWCNYFYRSQHISLAFAVFSQKRHLITFRKFRQLYREFWFPSPSKPPYSHICQIGDPVLRCKAEVVNPQDIKTKEIKLLLKKLRDVMKRYKAVGIAAPQIGMPLRIFAIEFTEQMAHDHNPELFKLREMTVFPFKVFINPELKVINYEKVQFPETCESVRGFAAEIPRYREILVKGLDSDGKPISLQVAGWPARIIQHEMDHLDGRLYTDIMVRSSFSCTCWENVNRTGGRIYVPFTPK